MSTPSPLGKMLSRTSMDNTSSASTSGNHTPLRPATPFSIDLRSRSNSATGTTLGNLKWITTPHIAALARAAGKAEGVAEAEVDQVCQLIHDLDQINPEEISDLCKPLLETNTKGMSNKGIELLLKAVNTKLMILNAAEIHLAAGRLDKKESISKGLSQWNKSSPANSSTNLTQMKARPVITGHPTLVNKPQTMRALLDQVVKFRSENELAELCKILWDGQGPRPQKPTVQEEAEHFAPIVQNILKSSHRIQKIVNQTAQDQGIGVPDANMVEPGNWIAGDRDGNPTIRASDLLSVVAKYSSATFDFYLDKLSDKPASQYAGSRPSLCRLMRTAGQGEKLDDIIAKLENTQSKLSKTKDFDLSLPHYASPDELIADLNLFEFSALDIENQESAHVKISRLQSDIRTFGFHGVNTDIRQNSSMNEKTVATLLQLSGIEENYQTLPEKDRVVLLAGLLEDNSKFPMSAHGNTSNPDFASEIELISAYKTIHENYGSSALKNCITANSETASDMLEVMVLLKQAGLMDQGLRMNVMPLIETVDDLKNAPDMLETMLKLPWYRKQLESANNIQHVMVGYSDSNRLDGPLASSWAVHECVNKLLDVAKKQGVQLQVFHGRGGTEARGSGHSYSQDISYLDGNSVALGVRQTEQGEEVPIKFGNQELADANLADMIGTTLSTASRGPDLQVKQHAALMNTLSSNAQQKYHSLYHHKDLASFFRNTTPISLIGLSNAGSRPPSRKVASNDVEYLAQMRAIPWTAAWYQTGNLMPAYFGIGTALQKHINSGGKSVVMTQSKVDQLRTLYKEWPFFKNVIDRTDMALHKADMGSAREFAKLDPATLHVFEMIESEFKLTRNMVQLIKQDTTDIQENSAKEAVNAKTNLRKFTQTMQAGLMGKLAQYPNSADSPFQKQLLVMTIQAISNSYGRHG